MAFLVVRPKSKVNVTTSAFINAGLSAYAAPIMDIELSDDPSSLVELQVAAPNIVIVTSTYSATWLCEQALTLDSQQLTIVCIGNSTAHILSQKFCRARLEIAHPENSEGALKLACLQQVRNKRIAIVKGQNGRDMLPSTLLERGATVCCINVYARVQNTDFDISDAFKPEQIQCIIVTSVELAQLTISIFDQKWCSKLHWMVASQRIKDYAVKQGISQITVSDGASNQALIKCAQHLVHTGVVNV